MLAARLELRNLLHLFDSPLDKYYAEGMFIKCLFAQNI